ncbi:hypothetical protein HJFPF1_03313 [Paramyrothecium foliicola]|nr:hypothetical protein HJFPF1_03313 [Paramyrothecium foliicola]
MRGLWLLRASALLLGPALAWASEAEQSDDSVRHSFLSLEPLPNHEVQEPEPIQFPLVVSELEPRCSGASVSLADRVLATKDGDTGFNSFTFLRHPNERHASTRGGNFTASWSFDCSPGSKPSDPFSMTLLVAIDSVDGVSQPVSINFAVHFGLAGSQTVITSIAGAKHHLVPYKELRNNGFIFGSPAQFEGEVTPATEFATEKGFELALEADKHKLERLRGKADPPLRSSVLFEETWPTADSPPRTQQSETYTTPYTPDQRERPLSTTSTSKDALMSSDAGSENPESSSLSLSDKLSALLGDQDLTTVLGTAVIFFALLSLLCVSFLHRRLVQKSEVDNNQHRRWWHCRRRRPRETVAERLARRFNRRHARVEAAKAWLSSIFGRLLAGVEEKEWSARQAQSEQQQQRTYPHVVETNIVDQPRPSLRREEEQTTMEQELAQFRAAASMVGDLIAAEEGRSRRAAASVPSAPRRSMESSMSVDTLPTYEESAPTGSVIADGFGFMPGSSAFVPSSSFNASPPGSNNSDRLGYGK